LRDRLNIQNREKTERGKRIFVEWLTENPGDADARSKLSWALRLLGEEKEALAEAQRALEQDPDQPRALYLAAQLTQRNPSFESLERIRRATDARPQEPSFYGSLAAAYLGMDARDDKDQRRRRKRPELEAALRVAEDGLGLDPQEGICLYARAHALICLGRRAEAIDTLDYLCALAESPRGLRYPIFSMYLSMLEPIRAIKVWRQLRD
jgi:tetratricopeptide (TPR) repeat protein